MIATNGVCAGCHKAMRKYFLFICRWQRRDTKGPT